MTVAVAGTQGGWKTPDATSGADILVALATSQPVWAAEKANAILAGVFNSGGRLHPQPQNGKQREYFLSGQPEEVAPERPGG